MMHAEVLSGRPARLQLRVRLGHATWPLAANRQRVVCWRDARLLEDAGRTLGRKPCGPRRGGGRSDRSRPSWASGIPPASSLSCRNSVSVSGAPPITPSSSSCKAHGVPLPVAGRGRRARAACASAAAAGPAAATGGAAASLHCGCRRCCRRPLPLLPQRRRRFEAELSPHACRPRCAAGGSSRSRNGHSGRSRQSVRRSNAGRRAPPHAGSERARVTFQPRHPMLHRQAGTFAVEKPCAAMG